MQTMPKFDGKYMIAIVLWNQSQWQWYSIRHENQVFFSKFFFWKSCWKQKLEIFIFVNILRLKVSSWSNLKILTRRLLFWFPNLTFHSKLLGFQLFTLQNYKSFKMKTVKNNYGNFYVFFIRFRSKSVVIAKI